MYSGSPSTTSTGWYGPGNYPGGSRDVEIILSVPGQTGAFDFNQAITQLDVQINQGSEGSGTFESLTVLSGFAKGATSNIPSLAPTGSVIISIQQL